MDDQGDEVSFGVVSFADEPVGVGAGGVEVSQVDVFDAEGGIVVAEDLFDHAFGSAIGGDGILGVMFVDGDGFGVSIDGTGRREDEIGDIELAHDVEEIEGVDDVVAVVEIWFFDGFGDEREGAEVHDGLDGMVSEALF